MDNDIEELRKEVEGLRSLIVTRLLGSSASSNYNPSGGEPIYDYRIVSQSIRVFNAAWTDNSPSAGRVAWSECTITYMGNTYDVLAGSSLAGQTFIYWQAASPNVFQASAATPTLGDDDFLIAVNISGTHHLAWNKSGVVDTLAIITSALYVSGLTLHDNSPIAGKIAWDACVVYYNGLSYAIAAGNTANTYVYWNVGDAAFSDANVVTPSRTTFVIATNNAGVADTAWNKLAAIQVQTTNLLDKAVTNAKVNDLSASKINTGILTVGGTAGVDPRIDVVDGALAGIGFVGVSGTDRGAWFKTISIGGTSYATGKFKADASGNVTINDATVTLTDATYTSSLNTAQPTGGGATQNGFNVMRISSGSSVTHASGFVVSINGNGKPTASLATLNEATAGSGGAIRVFDGSGAGGLGSGQIFKVDGSTAVISLYGGWMDFENATTVTAGAAGAIILPLAQGLLKVVINGTTYGIPFYNV